ncbi:actin cytoskeleton and mitosis protein [Elasticomyces elasticus]|nr:actin cytoskeleton and mitosis protein [Elasticomyces elasticus]
METTAARTNNASSRGFKKTDAGTTSGGAYQEKYLTLKRQREIERQDAIANGFLADPDKPRTLADAITPVGTCPDMCPEFERVERIVQKDIWSPEQEPDNASSNCWDRPADELRMVKKFRRSAAGVDEQLPSDLRPPAVLKKTVDYLFNRVIGDTESLASVHYFVWDRTRAIRNDFSIQQVSKKTDVLLAIECYEKVARFHIVSLHQLAQPKKPYDKYDWYQEREQLDRTLLSLQQYYQDNRGVVTSSDEAEFRAYCIIFQIQDPIPDLESRVQGWSQEVIEDSRVQRALAIYYAACSITDIQGPLKPATPHLIAQQNWQRFFTLVESHETSYLMACVAEVYFSFIRRNCLHTLWKAYRQSGQQGVAKNGTDWTLPAVTEAMRFDDESQTKMFCEHYGFKFVERPDGITCLDLNAVAGQHFPDLRRSLPAQAFSFKLVEQKRYGRTLPSTIAGVNVKTARDHGMLEEEEGEEFEEVTTHAEEDSSSLFVPQDKGQQSKDNPNIHSGAGFGTPSMSARSPSKSTGASPETVQGKSSTTAVTEHSAAPNVTANGGSSKFGRPSGSPFGAQTAAAQSPFAIVKSTFGQPSAPHAPIAPSPFGDYGAVKDMSPFSMPSIYSLGAKPLSSQTAPDTSENTKSLFAGGFPNFSKKPTPSPASQLQGLPFPPMDLATHDSTPNPQMVSIGSDKDTKPVSISNNPFSQLPQDTALSLAIGSVGTESVAAEQLPRVGAQTLEGPVSGRTPPNPFQSLSTTPDKATKEDSQIRPPAVSVETAPTTQLFAPAKTTSESVSLASNYSWTPPNQPKKSSPLASVFTPSSPQKVDVLERPTYRTPVEVGKKSVPNVQGAADQELLKKVASIPASSPGPLETEASSKKSRIIDELATEVILDPYNGFLRQFIEFLAEPIIEATQESIRAEKMQKEADNFRREILGARLGREKRKRAIRTLQKKQSDSGQINTWSQSCTDASTDSGRSWNKGGFGFEDGFRSLQQQTTDQPTSKASQVNDDNSQRSNAIIRESHNRLKSPSHPRSVSDISTRSPARSTTSALARSMRDRDSYLNFSLHNAPRDWIAKSTTKSNYFKLKALGIDPNTGLPALKNGKKRTRSHEDDSKRSSPPAKVARSPTTRKNLAETTWRNERASGPQLDSSAKSDHAPLTAATAERRQTNDEDEALFTRVRAAREALAESTAFYRSEVQRGELCRGQSPPSVSPSRQYESPSLAQARTEARSRDSKTEYMPNVPRYRLRESRFVPKEDYSKAIERAKEIREARNQASSRMSLRLEPASKGPDEALRRTQGNPRLAVPSQSQPLTPTLERSQDRDNNGQTSIWEPAQPIVFGSLSEASRLSPQTLASPGVLADGVSYPALTFTQTNGLPRFQSRAMEVSEQQPNGVSYPVLPPQPSSALLMNQHSRTKLVPSTTPSQVRSNATSDVVSLLSSPRFSDNADGPVIDGYLLNGYSGPGNTDDAREEAFQSEFSDKEAEEDNEAHTWRSEGSNMEDGPGEELEDHDPESDLQNVDGESRLEGLNESGLEDVDESGLEDVDESGLEDVDDLGSENGDELLEEGSVDFNDEPGGGFAQHDPTFTTDAFDGGLTNGDSAGWIRGGTGASVEEAFELSD